MGLEFKVSIPGGIDSIIDFEEFKQFRTYWKYDERYDNYYLGHTSNSDWPELMVWEKDQCLGITINTDVGPAFEEIQAFIKDLKDKYPDLSITDWDSGEDVSAEFFSEADQEEKFLETP